MFEYYSLSKFNPEFQIRIKYWQKQCFHLRDEIQEFFHINRISQITFQETVCGLVKHCALGSVTKAIQDFINIVFQLGAR